jgi:Protein of unknown function (DUF3570)
MKRYKKLTLPNSLSALSASALVLPGLLPAITLAAEDDNVDFQYSHYQEGKRAINGTTDTDGDGVSESPNRLKQHLNPIEVNSINGSGRFTLTDRIKFAFNYTQDTWAGATPIATAPAVVNANNSSPQGRGGQGTDTIAKASPYLVAGAFFTNPNQSAFYLFKRDHVAGDFVPGKLHNQLTHVLSYASPETRQQGDFKLSYAWTDEVGFDIGGGISVENDYESRFGSIGGHFDFNQKQTTFNWSISYTNSDTNAQLDPDALPYFNTSQYENSYIETGKILAKTPLTNAGEVNLIYDESQNVTAKSLHGNRQDWGVQLGLNQMLSPDALLSLDFGYTGNTGYLANPYKTVFFFPIDPSLTDPIKMLEPKAFLETRPDERNQFNWHVGYDQFIAPLAAALHFDYSFAHDDWGINAHTFEADWVQPLGAGWTLTPRIRYYSQSAASFYTTGSFTNFDVDYNVVLPKHYSSDQRLSGFGALSGGLTLEKKFTKGVSLQTGFEYYTHQGSLKLGGGGEQDFADFDYWVANAALKVNLAALSMPGGGHADHAGHAGHHHHSNTPAGVQFDHVLPKAGDFMVGYRYMRNVQAGDFRLGDKLITLDQARQEGCYGEECAVTPDNMTMNMHMLDLMYAPTDWLTLMFMPQWTDMDMTMIPNPDVQLSGGHAGHSGAVHEHQTGGIGDFGAYGLFKLYGDNHHKVNLTLGGTAPTGDVDIAQRKTSLNPTYINPLHYCMQLGSGTWDFKPALTYTGNVNKFSWGAQANATIRLEGQNKSGFAFGDIFQGTAWGGYQWTDWLGTSVRGVFTSQGEIRGRYPNNINVIDDTNLAGSSIPYVDQHIDTFGQPENYGGSFVDLGLGINVTVPHGAFAGNSLKFEWLQPVYTNFNGYQPDRDYALNFTWSYGF